MTKPIYTQTGAAAADNAVVFEIAGNGEQFEMWELSSTAGAMDVQVSMDGTNYLATEIALIDLMSTTPSVAVIETAAGKCYAFMGRFRKLKVLQKGATAVVAACLTGWERD